MAINTSSVSQLITDFRALKAKDSITPESLGYILQRLADLLATAGNSETIAKIQTLLDGFRVADYAIPTYCNPPPRTATTSWAVRNPTSGKP